MLRETLPKLTTQIWFYFSNPSISSQLITINFSKILSWKRNRLKLCSSLFTSTADAADAKYTKQLVLHSCTDFLERSVVSVALSSIVSKCIHRVEDKKSTSALLIRMHPLPTSCLPLWTLLLHSNYANYSHQKAHRIRRHNKILQW